MCWKNAEDIYNIVIFKKSKGVAVIQYIYLLVYDSLKNMNRCRICTSNQE